MNIVSSNYCITYTTALILTDSLEYWSGIFFEVQIYYNAVSKTEVVLMF